MATRTRTPFGSSADWTLVVALSVLLWMVLLFQGLPVGDLDDWDHILFAQDVSWSVLLENIVRPWSESPFWYGQGEFLDHVIHERVLPTFLLKSISTLFGLQFFSFYFFYKATFFAGTVSLLYLLLRRTTRSHVLAVCGSAFFTFMPVHYLHVLWISDPITVVHFFTLLGIWLYLRIASNLDQNGSFQAFLALSIGLFAVGWLAIKSKAPALIFPLVLGVYTLTRLRSWQTQKMRIFVLLALFALLAFQVVPVVQLRDGTGSFLAFFTNLKWQTIYHMTILQPESIYGGEAKSAFFCLRHIFPSSIARTLGFFSLWTLIVFTTLYWIRRQSGRLSQTHWILQEPVAVISLIWILIEIPLMGFFLPESRFFSGTLIPITILSLRLISCVLVSSPHALNKMLIIFPCTAFLWHGTIENLQHTIWIRTQKDTIYTHFLNLAKTIYRDHDPNDPMDMRDLASFYNLYVQNDWLHKKRLPDLLFHADFALDDWKKTESGSLEDYGRYAQTGAVYYATFSKDKLMNEPNVRLLDTVSNRYEDSFFEWLVHRLKRKKPSPLYIFKWVFP